MAKPGSAVVSSELEPAKDEVEGVGRAFKREVSGLTFFSDSNEVEGTGWHSRGFKRDSPGLTREDVGPELGEVALSLRMVPQPPFWLSDSFLWPRFSSWLLSGGLQNREVA